MDKSDIKEILHQQAYEPVSFHIKSNNPEEIDTCLDVDCVLLEMLNPVTWSDALCLVAHKLCSSTILLAQATTKLEQL
jgi:hypothetical protein